MCLPAIPALVAAGISGPMQAMIAITAALSAATSVGTAVSASNAQGRQNQRAAETAARARALESAKLGASMRQSAEIATRKKLGIERARISAQGEAMTQAAETGGQGNFLQAIQRNVNLQAGDKVSAVEAQQALARERGFFSNAESNQRLAGRIAGLPEPPNMGLAIGGSIIQGATSAINMGVGVAGLK